MIQSKYLANLERIIINQVECLEKIVQPTQDRYFESKK